jgi:hypothetical protein
MELTLPIFYHTKETQSKHDMGIDYPITDCDLRDKTFYRIDSINQYFEDFIPTDYTEIEVGGQFYICSTPYEVVKREIKSHLSGKTVFLSY